MEILFYILAGLIAGVFGGMGMGGGTVLIPILTIFLNTGQYAAQGINLIVFIPMAIVAIILHIRNKLIDFKILLFLILPGIIATVGGVFLAKQIDKDILQKLFGGFLILLGIFQIIFTFINKYKNKAKHSD